MEPELLFRAANLFVLMGWAALIFAPGRRAALVLAEWVVPLAISLAYALLLGSGFGKSEGGFGSLAGVARLFAVPELLLAGWLHYLAFDLLIGTHIVRSSRAEGIPHLAVLPVLVVTFLFGPVGFLLSALLRGGFRLRAPRSGPGGLTRNKANPVSGGGP